VLSYQGFTAARFALSYAPCRIWSCVAISCLLVVHVCMFAVHLCLGVGRSVTVSGLLCVCKIACFAEPLTLKLCCYYDADQMHLDNSIPLSPQWLYAKPIDAKVCDHRPLD
jgi:hypothetical protein